MSDANEAVVTDENAKAFDPSKIDPKHLKAAVLAQKLGHHVHAKNPEGVARDLISYYKRATLPEHLFQCTECGGASPAVLDDCPYCGFAGDDSGDPEALSRSDSRPEPTTAIVRAVSATIAVVPRAPSSSPSLLAGRAPQVDLDMRVQKIRQLKAAGATACWDLGTELNRLRDESLWMLRLNDVGTKQKWKNFEAFCHHELTMSPANAQELMRVARNYSRDAVAEFGTKKFLLALQAPKEDRERVEEAIKSGASKREIEKQVRKANEGRETTSRVASTRLLGGKGGSVHVVEAEAREMKLVTPLKKAEAERADTGDSAAVEKAGQKKITVANILGVQKIKLFKKASMDMKDPDPKAGTRAKRVSDQPWGWTDLANGVRQYYQLQASASGELELRVTIKRLED